MLVVTTQEKAIEENDIGSIDEDRPRQCERKNTHDTLLYIYSATIDKPKYWRRHREWRTSTFLSSLAPLPTAWFHSTSRVKRESISRHDKVMCPETWIGQLATGRVRVTFVLPDLDSCARHVDCSTYFFYIKAGQTTDDRSYPHVSPVKTLYATHLTVLEFRSADDFRLRSIPVIRVDTL
jgi:hypothetical protein